MRYISVNIHVNAHHHCRPAHAPGKQSSGTIRLPELFIRIVSDSPQINLITTAFSVVKALRVSRPRPQGSGTVEHSELGEVLSILRERGVPGLADQRPALATYRQRLESIDPDSLDRGEALAYWLNLYNAGALDLAADTSASGETSVLRTPGAFTRPWATVAGKRLSLNDIEHGKVRRFRDPRVHGALVCGSASCPTLRFEPYVGSRIDEQMEDQMRAFVSGGGAVADGSQLMLSRIFLWYGGDFVRPHRMPSFLPVSKAAVRNAIEPWLDEPLRGLGGVAFLPYDWSLACAIR